MDYQALADLLFPHLKYTREYYEEKYPKRVLKDKAMVTRFAPSPTGFIHMGSLYASFVSYVFANQTDGIFYLRIEDTDQKREVEHGVEQIISDLKKEDISFDEGPGIGGAYGPYIQSERKEIYEAFVYDLMKRGYAYPAFETKEELDDLREKQEQQKQRLGYYGVYATARNLTYEEIKKHLEQKDPYVIRLKSNGKFEDKFTFKDCIKGKIELPSNDMDIVLLKQDGLPTYHFAHVVDDYLMGTTHVVRGDEWLSSVPVHLQLFRLLGVKAPKYAHIAPLTKKEGTRIRKLSKRYDKECSMSFYQEEGIPTNAIKIYLATLLNTSFEDYYLSDRQARISNFSFTWNKMSVGGSLFDLTKLQFLSKTYLSRLSAEQLYEEILPFYQTHDNFFYKMITREKEYTLRVLNVERTGKKPRKDFATYQDIKKHTWYMYDTYYYEDDTIKRAEIKDSYDKKLVQHYFEKVYDENDTKDIWYEKLKEFISQYDYAKTVKEYLQKPGEYIGHVGDFCEMIRVYLFCSLETPDIYELLQILSKERILKRLNHIN